MQTEGELRMCQNVYGLTISIVVFLAIIMRHFVGCVV